MKSAVIAVVVILGAAASLVVGQVPFAGACPKQAVVQSFNAPAYLGKWYEQEKYFAIFQAGGKCVTAVYSDEGKGVVGVNNTQINIADGKPKSIKGTATLVDNSGAAKLAVRFPSNGNFPAPYWVLDTDYTSYAIVWSCTNFLTLGNAQFMWILTREKNPNSAVITKVYDILKQRNLATKSLTKTAQDCSN